MDFVKQKKGEPTIDVFPDGHRFAGEVLPYKIWLTVNPHRWLTDISRWHELHEQWLLRHPDLTGNREKFKAHISDALERQDMTRLSRGVNITSNLERGDGVNAI